MHPSVTRISQDLVHHVICDGRIDVRTQQLVRTAVQEALDAGALRVVVDFAAVVEVDLPATVALAALAGTARRAGADLTVEFPSAPRARRFLDRAGLTDLLAA